MTERIKAILPHMAAAAITLALLMIGNALMAGAAAVRSGEIEIGER